MAHLHRSIVGLSAALAAVAFLADHAAAQCSTCAAPTVAYYQPTVAAYPAYATYYRPGLLDRLRMRRWGVAPVAAAPTYATTYAPYVAGYTPYSAGYTPYAASYAPLTASYASYTAAYTPYVTAYAPLAAPVMQTSYLPVTSGCSTCAQPACSTCTTAVLRPVVVEPACTTCSYAPATCAADCGCSACSAAAPCSTCASAPTSATPAAYYESTPAAGCAGCAAAPATPGTPATPQPQMSPQEAAPATSGYPGTPVMPQDNGAVPDPAPSADDASTYFAPPQLLGPTNDRTANRPSVDVWNAVYRRPTTVAKASASVAPAAPAPARRTQAQIDAEGWESTPAR